jgi:hypothetical protein
MSAISERAGDVAVGGQGNWETVDYLDLDGDSIRIIHSTHIGEPNEIYRHRITLSPLINLKRHGVWPVQVRREMRDGQERIVELRVKFT